MASEQKTSSQVIAEALHKGRLEVEDTVHGLCPCGLRFRVGTVGGVPVVLHESPPCAEFVRREPDDFLHYVNVRQGRYN